MANTRFNFYNYKKNKLLQEATGPGRYMLNTPGPSDTLVASNDPYCRLQKWGGNLGYVVGGHPIDIDSELIGLTKRVNKYGEKTIGSKTKTIINQKHIFKSNNMTDQSRTTHPAWMYLDLEQNHKSPLFLDPQANVEMRFTNNLNTRLLERDYHNPVIPETPYRQ